MTDVAYGPSGPSATPGGTGDGYPSAGGYPTVSGSASVPVAAEPGPADTDQPAYASPEPVDAPGKDPDDTGVRARAGAALEHAGDVVSDAASRAVDVARETAGTVVERLRNNATLPAERGRTTIADEVVQKIAGIAAREVPGVHDLGGDAARLLSAAKEKLRLGAESAAQGVDVRLEGRGAQIEIVLVVEYGFVVYSVTEKVREKVISAVESLLGLDVQSVDVVVDDVHVPESGPAGDDADRAAGYTAETRAIVVGAPPA